MPLSLHYSLHTAYSMKLLPSLILLSRSVLSVVSADETTTPTQIHLALNGQTPSGDSTGMSVSYQTVVSTASSVVKYSTSLADLQAGGGQLTAEGTCSTYYQTYDHHVRIEDLTPSTLYFYKAGDLSSTDSDSWSDIYFFKSAPISADQHTVKFAAWGDLGLVNGSRSTTGINKKILM